MYPFFFFKITFLPSHFTPLVSFIYMSLIGSLTSLSRSLRHKKIGNDHIFINRAGQKFRESKGIDRSGNAMGPLHDLSDYHFIGKLTYIYIINEEWIPYYNNKDK